jgi:hypothetical protein
MWAQSYPSWEWRSSRAVRAPRFARITVDACALRYLTAWANFNQRCELLNACHGRRSVPPAKGDDIAEISIAVPWRERPPVLTAWPAKPTASEVVAHTTLSLPQPERSSPLVLKALRVCSLRSARAPRGWWP